ncbi:MAG: 6-carboxyhexanoate--CoA ligase [Lachnospiraceae bacterium]|nr:6-carboxyhexanoate--CoA ligase [Lachnospiraceae bacterium]
MDEMYSVKMRANQICGGKDVHISGAERIIGKGDIDTCCGMLLKRAVYHSKGEPDFINIKVEKIDEKDIEYIDALPVTTYEVSTADEGLLKLEELMREAGIAKSSEIAGMMKLTYGMRGAMLVDIRTLDRLEPDRERGVRVTYMDGIAGAAGVAGMKGNETGKNHFREALVLATKVAACPNIVGELCISDDPDYVTGYFASRNTGYCRITRLKEPGDSCGGRIFLYDGERSDVGECIRFLEKQKVLVRMDSFGQDKEVF